MKNKYKILMVYPEFPDTFWSFKHALKFINKKASNPPLGLLTVAAMLPEDWPKKLVDMNVEKLKDKDLEWAEYVFVSAMSVQKKSVEEIVNRCKKAGVKVVAGGPLFTTGYEDFKDIDHFVLNEAELTLAPFISDLENGTTQHIYSTGDWADLSKTPQPLWKMINMKKYATMNIQYSRGCPFNCDFCDITLQFGRVSRTKKVEQVISELETLYKLGWRGSLFFVDDNFIGHRKKLKKEILPAISSWMAQHKYPFSFLTQASIDLSDDEELMEMMVKANFNTVFVGIETPNEESLHECTKTQNKGRDLIACVKKMQRFGLQVQGGFIVGFDSDPHSIFETQIKFIQESGIVTAMVGILNAMRGTKLYNRLNEESRLVNNETGNNTDCSTNFIPKMNYNKLIEGYKSIISTIYSPKHYYIRIKKFLNEYKPLQKRVFRFRFTHISLLLRVSFFLGILGKERVQYWKLVGWSLIKHPRSFQLAMTFAVYGFHFRKIFKQYL
jgi:radical SAM superfamily enzyme YgiQ (UPF0313 family)